MVGIGMALGLVMEKARIYGLGVKIGEKFRVIARRSGVELAVVTPPCPREVGGVDVVLLTDLHIHGPRDAERAKQVVELLKTSSVISSPSPFLVLGGDTWDEATKSLEAVDEVLTVLDDIEAEYRVAVLGNHEVVASTRGSIALEEGLDLLRSHGYIVLRDKSMRAGGLRIAGLDWHWNIKDYPVSQLRGAELVVAHTPDIYPRVDWGPVLVLAGHTHGGQVCLPGARSVITNSRAGYTWGLYHDKDRVLVVSRGLGEKNRLRVFCPRQVVVVKCGGEARGLAV